MAEVLAMCHSNIAYVAAVHENQFDVMMLAWSSGAMAGCKIEDKPIDYSIDKMGLWGDAMREKKICVTNDYPQAKQPSKHGYPEGHVAIRRHLNGPIIHKGKVIAIIGVGNSSSEYTADDEKKLGDYLAANRERMLEMRDLAFAK